MEQIWLFDDSKRLRCSSTSIQRPRSWRLQGSKTVQLLCKRSWRWTHSETYVHLFFTIVRNPSRIERWI